MLYRTLLRHPSFAPRAETLQESSFVRQAPLAHRFDAGHPSNIRRYMLSDDAWRAFLDSLRPIRPLLATAALTQPLLACFPRARLLYIHRHPVDVYSSYVRRGQTDPKASWARIPLEEFCALYRRNARRAAEAAARRPEAVRLLSYEAFTAAPEAELRAVCQFLGEPFDPGVLTGFDVEEARVAHWEGSSLLYSAITTTTKNWRDYLSEADARRVEELLEPELARFGYARAAR